MFALKGKKVHPRGAAPVSSDRPSYTYGAFGRFRFVLPKFLRKPVRVFTRMVEGEVHIPNHTGTLGAVVFLALTGAYGAILGGHAPRWSK